MPFLTDEQIQTLRVEWIDDYIDLRPQWGSPVAGSASKGALSLSLSGLASVGTLQSGTRFGLVSNGQAMNYYLTADAPISSSTATITFAPPLIGNVLSGTAITPEPRQKSLYNKRTGRLYFADSELQNLADRVWRLRGRYVRSADDPDVTLFRAIRYYGWTSMLSSDEYLNTVLAGNDYSGTNKLIVDQKRQLLSEDANIIFSDQTGPQNVRFIR